MNELVNKCMNGGAQDTWYSDWYTDGTSYFILNKHNKMGHGVIISEVPKKCAGSIEVAGSFPRDEAGLPMYLKLGSPEADPESKMPGQVVYSGGDPGNTGREVGKREQEGPEVNTGCGNKLAVSCCGQWGIDPNEATGRLWHTLQNYPVPPPTPSLLLRLGIYPLVATPHWLKAAPRGVESPVLPVRWRLAGACGGMTLAGAWWVRGEGSLGGH